MWIYYVDNDLTRSERVTSLKFKALKLAYGKFAINAEYYTSLQWIFNQSCMVRTKHILSSLIDHPLRLFILLLFFKSNCE